MTELRCGGGAGLDALTPSGRINARLTYTIGDGTNRSSEIGLSSDCGKLCGTAGSKDVRVWKFLRTRPDLFGRLNFVPCGTKLAEQPDRFHAFFRREPALTHEASEGTARNLPVPLRIRPAATRSASPWSSSSTVNG